MLLLLFFFFFHRQLNFSPSDVSSASDADNAGMDYHNLEKKQLHSGLNTLAYSLTDNLSTWTMKCLLILKISLVYLVLKSIIEKYTVKYFVR